MLKSLSVIFTREVRVNSPLKEREQGMGLGKGFSSTSDSVHLAEALGNSLENDAAIMIQIIQLKFQ